MDRMRDVPSEEYATLHDVYMMLTSLKGSYGMNFDLFYSNKNCSAKNLRFPYFQLSSLINWYTLNP